ncbi:plasminogen-like [Saccostrea echinata]|uniref:plasminogen-like n=1 Tax=Saccostrea echinata TaxID=191078 RepID=UPI002A80F623|nr:plasminogen-like [Saccostrea echinata]
MEFLAKNCKKTTKGLEYRGTTSVTRSGRKCQRWDSQYPHYHYFYRLASVNENFCRNPDSDSRPWCYTTDPQKRWEYCDIPVCEEDRCKGGGVSHAVKIISQIMLHCVSFYVSYYVKKEIQIITSITQTNHLQTSCLISEVKKSELLIRVGDWNNKVPDLYEEEFELEEIYSHEEFDKGTWNNDIALLKVKPKLGRGITMVSSVQPACLPSEATVYSENLDCYISGWGKMENGISSNLLKYAQIPIVNQTTCKRLYKSHSITNSMFCAGYINGGSDTCQGDSGGPLVCKVNGKYTVLGVTSWGRGCGLPNYPGVYANVKSLLPWIRGKLDA